MFDSSKTGKIEREKVRLILNTLGYTYDDGELDGLLSAEDTEGELVINHAERIFFLYFLNSHRILLTFES